MVILMASTAFAERVELPDRVTVTYSEHRLAVKGPKGESSKILFHPHVKVGISGDALTLEATANTQREKKSIYTFRAHIRNMIKGVTDGYTAKMKICSGHFPMTVAIKGQEFEVKNFCGEKVPRTVTIKDGVEVKVDGSDIIITGSDKERVGQAAADIEQLTRRPGFDTRVFQDGIYLVEKAQ